MRNPPTRKPILSKPKFLHSCTTRRFTCLKHHSRHSESEHEANEVEHHVDELGEAAGQAAEAAKVQVEEGGRRNDREETTTRRKRPHS